MFICRMCYYFVNCSIGTVDRDERLSHRCSSGRRGENVAVRGRTRETVELFVKG